MALILIVIAVVIVIVIANSKKTSPKSPQKQNGITCLFQPEGSCSSVLNRLEQNVSYIAKYSHGYGEISVCVSVQKIDHTYCKISGSFLADCGFHYVQFGNGYRFNGTDYVSFETNRATGFTTVEDVKREMLLQFNWFDLPVYDAKFTVLAHGDYINHPYISYSFTVKDERPSI